MSIVKTEPNLNPNFDDFFRTIQLTYAPKTEAEVKFQEPQSAGRIQTLEGVFVPRFEDILEQDRIAKDIADRLQRLRNPNVKLKKNGTDLCLSPEVLYSRLKDIDFYPNFRDPSILCSTVSRRFMSHRYGGSKATCFPNIRQKRVKEHGYNDFMFLNPNLNPHAPQIPGAPGLYLEVRPSKADYNVNNFPNLKRVYVRLRVGAWLKVGIYKLTRSEPLSKEEMSRADMAKMRSAWADQIATRKSKWGKSMRCSIKLRAELEREPTSEEFDDAMRRNDLFTDVSTEDISRAFLLGNQVVSIWTMECVDYDIKFQQATVEAFKNWTRGRPLTSNHHFLRKFPRS
ncbi:hypothetical protein K435DRAFT_966781 [Dendrothele bispora CBS 962.96]|uniref:DUF6697 domain-containing protein n=1 Tax=Dendrothele bispora (strain CBS 962.96) TaxID=1314807 RepID=A0A4S8LY41_DENBC|nr:hypothetical protein K435DRAFT_966781 [Dendrothele bispora CBS 962.96]